MLSYFKKHRSRRRLNVDDTKGIESEDVTDNVKRNSLKSTSSFCDEVFFEDESLMGDSDGCSTTTCVGTDEDIFKYNSRLSMSLTEIVKDQNCLGYFVQYMESKKSLPLIKFYLDVENFRIAAFAQLEIERNNDNVNPADAAVPADSKDKSSVPELRTLCDVTMRKPLTDDEKSKIYADITQSSSSKAKAISEASLDSTCASIAEIERIAASSECFCATASISDAVAIYQKYLKTDSQQYISLPIAILSQISLLLCKRADYEEEGVGDALQISADCFVEAQLHVLKQMEDEFLGDFLQSTYYCKYCVELIENAASSAFDDVNLTICDILYSEATLFFFMEFLEQQRERDCLDFWTAAINFRKSYYTTEDREGVYSLRKPVENEIQADAMIIYEKYFSLQSESRLWMSDKIRCKVEEAICATDEVGKCFDLPLLITAKYLEQKYLEGFLNSNLFGNYVNELKSRLHEHPTPASGCMTEVSAETLSAGAAKTSRHRKTMSDCTNAASSTTVVKHISQYNTLLAMGESKPYHVHSQLKLQQAAATSDLSIDASQLTNPELLWQRPHTGGDLRFGQINALGRYERDFDVLDNSSNTHKSSLWIKNAVRKLVNLPEERVQEEIAWQIAEMIVKDVTSVTLGEQ